MTAEVHVNDWGTVLKITLKDGANVVPLADATEIKMRLSDPDDVTTIKDLTVVTPPGTEGKVKYVFLANELHTAGGWDYQVKVTFPAGFWQSDLLSFTVYENIDVPSASVSPSASASPSA